MRISISQSKMFVKEFFEISGKKPEISDYTDYDVTITQIRDRKEKLENTRLLPPTESRIVNPKLELVSSL